MTFDIPGEIRTLLATRPRSCTSRRAERLQGTLISQITFNTFADRATCGDRSLFSEDQHNNLSANAGLVWYSWREKLIWERVWHDVSWCDPSSLPSLVTLSRQTMPTRTWFLVRASSYSMTGSIINITTPGNSPSKSIIQYPIDGWVAKISNECTNRVGYISSNRRGDVNDTFIRLCGCGGNTEQFPLLPALGNSNILYHRLTMPLASFIQVAEHDPQWSKDV